MERKLLIASTNSKKAAEMMAIIKPQLSGVEIVTLVDYSAAPEVEETGETFSENARLKALAGVKYTGLVTIADDGGLCIDALDGNPGVKSHRFLGANTSFPDKMQQILKLMAGTPSDHRSCRFICAVVIATPHRQLFECTGTCEGEIGFEMRGEHGFGYDPIFRIPALEKHMAELTPEEKQEVSHRGKALECAAPTLRDLFSSEP